MVNIEIRKRQKYFKVQNTKLILNFVCRIFSAILRLDHDISVVSGGCNRNALQNHPWPWPIFGDRQNHHSTQSHWQSKLPLLLII